MKVFRDLETDAELAFWIGVWLDVRHRAGGSPRDSDDCHGLKTSDRCELGIDDKLLREYQLPLANHEQRNGEEEQTRHDNTPTPASSSQCAMRLAYAGYGWLRIPPGTVSASGKRSRPVVAVSGLVSQADHERTQAAGFEGHLHKPFDDAALVQESWTQSVGASMTEPCPDGCDTRGISLRCEVRLETVRKR
jgi:hypothetical protein